MESGGVAGGARLVADVHRARVGMDVVTGASGQIGFELVRELLARGEAVRAIVVPGDRTAEPLRRTGAEVVEADVRDHAALVRAFAGARHLHHLAAVVSTSPRFELRMWQVNTEGVRNAVRAAREVGIARMIYFSSIVVFDAAPLDHPLDEHRARLAPAKVSPYVCAKIVAERIVRDHVAAGLDAVVVHPTVVIGTRELHHRGVVRTLFHGAFAGRLPAVVAGGFDAVAAADVARGAIAAAQRGRSGESYILGGQHHGLVDLLERTRALVGTSVPRLVIPQRVGRIGVPIAAMLARMTGTRPAITAEDLRQLAGNPHICSAKAQRELGYRAHGLDDALVAVHAEWLRSAGARA